MLTGVGPISPVWLLRRGDSGSKSPEAAEVALIGGGTLAGNMLLQETVCRKYYLKKTRSSKFKGSLTSSMENNNVAH